MTETGNAGRRVIVTGGSSGIGLATAQRFTRAAAQVTSLDLNQPPDPDVLWFATDVRDDASVRTAVQAAVHAMGGLDVLVNNAGIGAQGTVEDNTDEQWRTLLDVNVLGLVRVTRAALPALRHSATPCIVNTCSIAATAGLPQRALYSASKGAVLALTRAMAADHLHEGIRVNCVNPGTADTPWIDRLLQAAEDPTFERAALEDRQPMGRLITADEVAAAIWYLASPAAGSTTGTDLAVDGGMSGLRIPKSQSPS